MQAESNRVAKAAPKPLSTTAVKKLEAAGQKAWRLRDGTPYASRAERRAARAVARAEQDQKEQA